jgi:hypothetical protein
MGAARGVDDHDDDGNTALKAKTLIIVWLLLMPTKQSNMESTYHSRSRRFAPFLDALFFGRWQRKERKHAVLGTNQAPKKTGKVGARLAIPASSRCARRRRRASGARTSKP